MLKKFAFSTTVRQDVERRMARVREWVWTRWIISTSENVLLMASIGRSCAGQHNNAYFVLHFCFCFILMSMSMSMVMLLLFRFIHIILDIECDILKYNKYALSKSFQWKETMQVENWRAISKHVANRFYHPIWMKKLRMKQIWIQSEKAMWFVCV